LGGGGKAKRKDGLGNRQKKIRKERLTHQRGREVLAPERQKVKNVGAGGKGGKITTKGKNPGEEDRKKTASKTTESKSTSKMVWRGTAHPKKPQYWRGGKKDLACKRGGSGGTKKGKVHLRRK